jgi:CubicO group peptidase (beta-lactamase class C family)
MHLSTRDMARLGYLMLRKGRWLGAAIVPREWVRRIVTVVTPVDEMNPPYHRRGPFGYGYLWWVWDGAAATGAFAGAYSATGAVGQFITVLPKVDLVIAHKTRPGKGSVTLRQYLDLVNGILDARCTQPH